MSAEAAMDDRTSRRVFSTRFAEGLAARRPFVFHHRIDFALFAGGAISLVLTLLANALPQHDTTQPYPTLTSLDNANATAFFILLAATLVVSVYWLIMVFRNGEIGAQRFSAHWPSLPVIWAGLLWINLGPFLFANIAYTKIHGGVFAMFGNLRSNDHIWAGIFILIYALVAGFFAHGFRLIRLRGVAEALLGLVLTIAGLLAYVFLAIGVEEQVKPLFDATGLSGVIASLMGRDYLTSGDASGVAIAMSFLAAVLFLNWMKGPVGGGAPTTRVQRLAFLLIEWLLVPGVMLYSVQAFILYDARHDLPIGPESVTVENWWIAGTIVVAVIIANWLNARAVRMWARPRA
ncbi:MAG: hypothetical protein NW205_02230 [Hyphomicrobiaceae bacterium]|nr:hypothetical protein [Hyphomicrobiaceae bacterium]